MKGKLFSVTAAMLGFFATSALAATTVAPRVAVVRSVTACVGVPARFGAPTCNSTDQLTGPERQRGSYGTGMLGAVRSGRRGVANHQQRHVHIGGDRRRERRESVASSRKVKVENRGLHPKSQDHVLNGGSLETDPIARR